MCPRYDFRHPIRFRSSKEGPDHFVPDWPRSDLDVLVRFWPNASGPEASRCARIIGAWFLAERNRPATSFPLSIQRIGLHSYTEGPDRIVQNHPGSKPRDGRFSNFNYYYCYYYYYRQSNLQNTRARVRACVCESACVRACVRVCVCAFMLYTLNFDNMYL